MEIEHVQTWQEAADLYGLQRHVLTWQEAADLYGLQRPDTDCTIRVFRTLIQRPKLCTVCTRVDVPWSFSSSPDIVLANIAQPWADLTMDPKRDFYLIPVHDSRLTAFHQDLHDPVYLLLLAQSVATDTRPHCLLEIRWGCQIRHTAVALPTGINVFTVFDLLVDIANPLLGTYCEVQCNGADLSEELVKCSNGDFIRVNVIADNLSQVILLDLQHALDRHFDTMHLPANKKDCDEVILKVLVPHGYTSFSGSQFSCVCDVSCWERTLLDTAKGAFPESDSDTFQFLPVHTSFEESLPCWDPAVKYFIFPRRHEFSNSMRCAVLLLHTCMHKMIGAFYCCRQVSVFDILDLCTDLRMEGKQQWCIYHNSKRLSRERVEVQNGDFFCLF